MQLSIRPYKTKHPVIGKHVFVDESSVVIGDVSLGTDCSVWPMAVIRGDVNSIVIGDRTNVQDGSVLHVTHKSADNEAGYPLYIGNDVTIGHKACLHGCHIGDRVLIGMAAIIMDNVKIASNVFIAAGSLITPGMNLESGYLYKGHPAKKTRLLTEKEIKFLPYSSAHYVKLKNSFMQK